MAKGYFSLLGLKGTDEGFSLTLAFPGVTPSPTSWRGEKWDLNEDRPEGGPAGPKSPGRGDWFSSGTGWPGGKGCAEGGGKEVGHASASAMGSAAFAPPALPSLPVLQAIQPPASACSRLLVPGALA